MAEVTVNDRVDSVMGNMRAILANVDIAADADIFTTGLGVVTAVCATSATNNAIGATLTTDANGKAVVVLQTGGAEAGAFVSVFGQ